VSMADIAKAITDLVESINNDGGRKSPESFHSAQSHEPEPEPEPKSNYTSAVSPSAHRDRTPEPTSITSPAADIKHESTSPLEPQRPPSIVASSPNLAADLQCEPGQDEEPQPYSGSLKHDSPDQNLGQVDGGWDSERGETIDSTPTGQGAKSDTAIPKLGQSTGKKMTLAEYKLKKAAETPAIETEPASNGQATNPSNTLSPLSPTANLQSESEVKKEPQPPLNKAESPPSPSTQLQTEDEPMGEPESPKNVAYLAPSPSTQLIDEPMDDPTPATNFGFAPPSPSSQLFVPSKEPTPSTNTGVSSPSSSSHSRMRLEYSEEPSSANNGSSKLMDLNTYLYQPDNQFILSTNIRKEAPPKEPTFIPTGPLFEPRRSPPIGPSKGKRRKPNSSSGPTDPPSKIQKPDSSGNGTVQLGVPRDSIIVSRFYELCTEKGVYPDFGFEESKNKLQAFTGRLTVGGQTIYVDKEQNSKKDVRQLLINRGIEIVKRLDAKPKTKRKEDMAFNNTPVDKSENWVGKLVGRSICSF
jgi:hypothetical protein